MVPVSTIRPCLLKCLFQDPQNWVSTTLQDADPHYSVLRCKMQSPTTPSTVVAHNDSIWFTLPLYGNCPAVSSPSLLRSQTGAQFCDIWKAGLFVCNWLTLSPFSEATVPWFINSTSGLVSVEMLFVPSSLLCCQSGLLQPLWTTLFEDAGCIVPSSLHQQEIHLHCTCWDS